jgi:hypothetical protein
MAITLYKPVFIVTIKGIAVALVMCAAIMWCAMDYYAVKVKITTEKAASDPSNVSRLLKGYAEVRKQNSESGRISWNREDVPPDLRSLSPQYVLLINRNIMKLQLTTGFVRSGIIVVDDEITSPIYLPETEGVKPRAVSSRIYCYP